MADPPASDVNAYRVIRDPDCYDDEPCMGTSFEESGFAPSNLSSEKTETQTFVPDPTAATVTYYELSFLNPHDFSPIVATKEAGSL